MLVPPSPKVHDQLLGLPEDWSVKFTVSGAQPLVGDPVKSATGAELTTMAPPLVQNGLHPQLLQAVTR